MDTTKKRAYKAPIIIVEGSVKELTLGSATGKKLDKNFPAGTPFTSLTFSF